MSDAAITVMDEAIAKIAELREEVTRARQEAADLREALADEREETRREAIAITAYFRQQTDGRDTREDKAQRRMATRIIQELEFRISEGKS